MYRNQIKGEKNMGLRNIYPEKTNLLISVKIDFLIYTIAPTFNGKIFTSAKLIHGRTH
jgi:hypothetical protein